MENQHRSPGQPRTSRNTQQRNTRQSSSNRSTSSGNRRRDASSRSSASGNRKTSEPRKPFVPEVETTKEFPAAKEGVIRMFALGGLGETGKNMYAVECNKEIVLLECGIAFGESSTPGIATLMPNTRYLKDRKDSVRAVILTDAALIHTGALSYMTEYIKDCPVFLRDVTKTAIETRMKVIPRSPTFNMHVCEKPETVEVSKNFSFHFFGFSEETLSTMGVVIETPHGNIAYTGNLRVANDKGVIPKKEEKRFEILKEKDILVTMADSVNVERSGFAIYDEKILSEIEEMMKKASNRVIFPLFPSQIRRNSKIAECVSRNGKKIYVQGKDLYDNLLAAIDMKLLNLSKEDIRQIEDLKDADDPKKTALLLSSGEDENHIALNGIAKGMHKYISILEKDMVVFPSPMQDLEVRSRETQDLKDALSRMGATIRSYNTSDVKTVSHAGKAELRWLHSYTKPSFLFPIQGYHYMLTAHTHIFKDIGMSMDSTILLDNGMVVDIHPKTKEVHKHKKTLPTTAVGLNGRRTTPIQQVVLQDREILGNDGIFVVIILIDRKTLTLKKSPDIISRGFVYLRESRDFINDIRVFIKKTTEECAQEEGEININTLKKSIQKKISQFLMKETNKKPVIVPVIFTQ